MPGSVHDDAISFNTVNRTIEKLAAALLINDHVKSDLKLDEKRDNEIEALGNSLRFYRNFYNNNWIKANETPNRRDIRRQLRQDLRIAKATVVTFLRLQSERSVETNQAKLACNRAIRDFITIKDESGKASKKKVIPKDVIISSVCGLKAAKLIEIYSKLRGDWVRGKTKTTGPELKMFDEISEMLKLSFRIQTDVPHVPRTDHQLIDISEDGFVEGKKKNVDGYIEQPFEEESDGDYDIVPVEIQPGHIRFYYICKGCRGSITG